jgi:SET domain-containing protein 6
VTWSPAALRALQGTDLPESVASDRKRLRADWAAHVAPLCAAHPARFPPARSAFFSADAYAAARTLTASRAFAVDAYHGEGMVPLADLFNHEAAEDVHFTARAAERACVCACVRACMLC